MIVDYRFEQASGLSAESFYTIGVRFDEEYDHRDEQESWCVHVTPTVMSISNGYHACNTGIYTAPDGQVFICDGSGAVFRNLDPSVNPAAWVTDALDASLEGIWGLSSDYVLTWGGPDPKMFLWNGSTWSPMPHPGGWIREIRGTSADCLYAVGHKGLCFRWDGRRWNQVPCPNNALISVVVLDNDQVFASDTLGDLLVGSSRGMSKLLHFDETIASMTWWKGELWLGTGLGLGKLVDGKVEILKENIGAYSLDGRGDLIIGTCDYAVCSTDGETFAGYSVQDFGKQRVGYGPLWNPGADILIDHGDPDGYDHYGEP